MLEQIAVNYFRSINSNDLDVALVYLIRYYFHIISPDKGTRLLEYVNLREVNEVIF